MNDKDETARGLGKDTEVPDQGDDGPCGEVNQANARVPGEDLGRVKEPRCFHVRGDEISSFSSYCTWQLVGDADITYESMEMI